MSLKVSKNDIKIILLSAFIFVASFLVLYLDLFTGGVENSDQPIVAKAIEVNNDVRIKTDQQFAWSKSSKTQDIRWGDQIFTGEKSNVTLQLENNQQLKIQQNSLVKFEQLKNMKNFKVVYGSMTAQVKKGEKIEITICGEKLQIQSDVDEELQISNEDNCSKPVIQFPKAKRTVDVKPKRQHRIASVAKEMIVKMTPPVVIEPIKPIVIVEPPLPVEEPPAPPPPPPPVVLKAPVLKNKNYTFMSTDVLKTVEWERVRNAETYSISIYDLKYPDQALNKFEVQKTSFDFIHLDTVLDYGFSIEPKTSKKYLKQSDNISLGQIKIIYPAIQVANAEKNYTFNARTSNQKVPPIKHLLTWNKIPEASEYQIEFSKDNNFNTVLNTEKTTENQFNLNLTEPGKLFYRLKAYSKNALELSHSEKLSYVQYIKNFDLGPPAIPKAMIDQVFFFQNTDGQFIRLAWQNTQAEKAPNYYIEIAKTNDFTEVFKKFSSDRPYLLITETIPQGIYYWRVRSYGAEIVSDWSQTASLKVASKRAVAAEK